MKLKKPKVEQTKLTKLIPSTSPFRSSKRCSRVNKEVWNENRNKGFQDIKVKSLTTTTYNAGNCWNAKTCKFVKNGEVFSKSGCSVSYCAGK